MMVMFPIDPINSKALIESAKHKCFGEMASIISMLSTPNIFMRPLDKITLSNSAKSKIVHANSDHLTLLNIFESYKANNESVDWCYNNFINHWAMKSASNIKA